MKKSLLIFISIVILCGCSNTEIKQGKYTCSFKQIADNYIYQIDNTISYENEFVTSIESTTSYISDNEDLQEQFNYILSEYKNNDTADIKYKTEVIDNIYKIISTTQINNKTINSFDITTIGGVTNIAEIESPVKDDNLSLDLYIKYLEFSNYTCEKVTNQ